MKTGHCAIQLHTYGPQPSTCVNLYVCMPSGSVLSVPGVRLPSGCIQYVSACALPVYERLPSVSIVENVWQVMEAWYASCWVIPQLALSANCVPTNSLSRTLATTNYGICGHLCARPTTNTHLKSEIIQIPQRVWISHTK